MSAIGNQTKLSATFDMLDIDLLCKKLEMYGFTDLTVMKGNIW